MQPLTGCAGPSACRSMLFAGTICALYESKGRGAEILLEPSDKDYGGRDYTCRYLEGNIWSFGTFNPWTVGGNE